MRHAVGETGDGARKVLAGATDDAGVGRPKSPRGAVVKGIVDPVAHEWRATVRSWSLPTQRDASRSRLGGDNVFRRARYSWRLRHRRRRIGVARRVRCSNAELIFAPRHEVVHRGEPDAARSATRTGHRRREPRGTSVARLLYDVTGDETAAVCGGNLPLETDRHRVDCGHHEIARGTRHIHLPGHGGDYCRRAARADCVRATHTERIRGAVGETRHRCGERCRNAIAEGGPVIVTVGFVINDIIGDRRTTV